MTTHTPGPWQIRGAFRIVSSLSVILAEVFSPNGYDPDTREQKANALLIAAAPELFEALEDMLIQFGNTQRSRSAERHKESSSRRRDSQDRRCPIPSAS